jgi:hypothetical protein
MFSATFRDVTASIHVSVLTQWPTDTTTLAALIPVGFFLIRQQKDHRKFSL